LQRSSVDKIWHCVCDFFRMCRMRHGQGFLLVKFVHGTVEDAGQKTSTAFSSSSGKWPGHAAAAACLGRSGSRSHDTLDNRRVQCNLWAVDGGRLELLLVLLGDTQESDKVAFVLLKFFFTWFRDTVVFSPFGDLGLQEAIGNQVRGTERLSREGTLTGPFSEPAENGGPLKVLARSSRQRMDHNL